MPSKRLSRRHLLSGLVLAAGVSLSAFVALQVKNVLEYDAVGQFSFAADQIHLRINERLKAYALVLRGGAGLFQASDTVTRQDWHDYTVTLRAADTVAGIQGIGFAAAIHPEDLQEHIAAIRAEGFPDYTVRPDGIRELYAPVIFLEPFDARNQRAFGYDMFSESTRRAAMEKARDTGQPALSGKVELVQETTTNVQPGTLMYVPVYRPGATPSKLESRREALIGWSYSPFRMTDLMGGILGDWEAYEGQGMGLRIFDNDQANENSLLFSNWPETIQPATSLFTQHRQLDFNGQQWLLVFEHQNPRNAVNYLSAWITLISGLILSGLAFLGLRALANQQAQTLRIADDLAQALDLVPSYVYLKDRGGRYTFGNQAVLSLFNCTRDQLPDINNRQLSKTDAARKQADIDHKVLLGEHTEEEVAILDRNGNQRVLLEIKVPLRDKSNEQEITGLLGIATDITALKNYERELTLFAHYDALTHLPNRVLLGNRLNQAMVQSLQQRAIMAVVYLDLDGFKTINDRYGHAVGDELLVKLTKRMKQTLRQGDTLSRLGGDEFVAVLLDVGDIDDTAPLLKRLLAAAGRPLTIDGHTMQVSASLGVTFYPQVAELEADQLLRQADQAMYQAKVAGKARFHIFNPAEPHAES